MSNSRTVEKTLEDRFWAKVNKSGDCWIWSAALFPKGYGVFCIRGRMPRTQRAHRVSWELHYGPIPEGLCVLHRCDNPSCVRPEHLWLGTDLDNSRDMVAKGRDRRVGAHHGNARLTEKQVKDIKLYLAQGVLQRVIAKYVGMSESTIGHIKLGRKWGYIS